MRANHDVGRLLATATVLAACLRAPILAMLLQDGCDWLSGPPETPMVRYVVEQQWPSPATIEWRTIDVLERRTDGWVLAYVEFDAQNEFGALIRYRLHLAYQEVGSKVYWMKKYALQDIGRPPSSRLQEFKSLNRWPTDAHSPIPGPGPTL
jgi:hypothetical protein